MNREGDFDYLIEDDDPEAFVDKFTPDQVEALNKHWEFHDRLDDKPEPGSYLWKETRDGRRTGAICIGPLAIAHLMTGTAPLMNPTSRELWVCGHCGEFNDPEELLLPITIPDDDEDEDDPDSTPIHNPLEDPYDKRTQSEQPYSKV
jgi:hypothetical protein